MAGIDLPYWKPPPPRPRDLRQFGALLTCLSIGLAAYLAWRRGAAGAAVPAAAAAVLLLVSLAWPRLLTPVWWPWMVLVRVLGFVNSHLLLALVFYLMFTPLGLARRLFGWDPLDSGFARARRACARGEDGKVGQTTFWHRREQTRLGPHHYLRQF